MNKPTLVQILLLLSIGAVFFTYSSQKSQQLNEMTSLATMYENWKYSYGLTFSSEQENYRFLTFLQNLLKIQEHNAKIDRTYDLGLNQFAHLKSQQFASLFLGTKAIESENKNIRKESSQQNQINLNNLQDVDWQVLGKVSGVKNQGQCDAGYAFSSTGLIQTSLLMQNKNITLSEQQILDCSANYTTYGCSGGSRLGTLNFSRQIGLVENKTYPWAGVKGDCKKSVGDFKTTFMRLESNGCQEIKANLYKSPMTVAVNAQTWQLYKAGIFTNCPDSPQVNHDIYLIGVSLTSWRLKNSWGVRWGEYGYIRLGLGNTCAICEKTGFGFVL